MYYIADILSIIIYNTLIILYLVTLASPRQAHTIANVEGLALNDSPITGVFDG
jgi:hypothetical protein